MAGGQKLDLGWGHGQIREQMLDLEKLLEEILCHRWEHVQGTVGDEFFPLAL